MVSDKTDTTCHAYFDIADREWALNTEEARYLLDVLPSEISVQFVKGFLDSDTELQPISDYFACHSDIARIIRNKPSSAHAFEYLYNRQASFPIDKYFLASKSGFNVYRRLVQLEETLPRLIRGMDNGGRLLIDNIGSGQGYDMIRVMKNHPDLAAKVHIRNIDPDVAALQIGRRLTDSLGLSDSFSFEGTTFDKAEPRNADLILLIGIFCPLDIRTCRLIMRAMRRFARPGGKIIYSTAQERMGLGDPLTDYIMRFLGWHMAFKTDQEAFDLASSTTWKHIDEFYDEPDRYHCITIAEKQ